MSMVPEALQQLRHLKRINRLMTHVDQSSPLGCWEWTASRFKNGYGHAEKNGYAHRVMYEILVGPIPTGLDLDHLCRVRACCNPDHLEPVTRRENLRRGIEARIGVACKRGHQWTPENTYVDRKGTKRCHQCRKENYP